jgi:hypothetical protein
LAKKNHARDFNEAVRRSEKRERRREREMRRREKEALKVVKDVKDEDMHNPDLETEEERKTREEREEERKKQVKAEKNRRKRQKKKERAREKKEHANVEEQMFGNIAKAKQEQDEEFLQTYTAGSRLKLPDEQFPPYLDELGRIFAGMSKDYPLYAEEYNKLYPNPADVFISFTSDQINEFIKLFFDNMTDLIASIWYQVYDVLLLKRPDFSMNVTKDVLVGSMDDNHEYIPKSVFVRYITTLVQNYLRSAIDRKNFYWDRRMLGQILGLLDKKTASFILEHLMRDTKKQYVTDFIKNIRDYANHHAQNLALAIDTNYFQTTPIGCKGAISAIDRYFKFADDHRKNPTLEVKNQEGPFKINPIRKNKAMENVIENTRRCRL